MISFICMWLLFLKDFTAGGGEARRKPLRLPDSSVKKYLSSQFPNQLNLILSIRCSIGKEYIMKPFNRLVSIFHRCIPGINGITLSAHKSPINSPTFSFFKIGNIFEKRLLRIRAMYSVQINGLPKDFSN